jgi:hypothetical protein
MLLEISLVVFVIGAIVISRLYYVYSKYYNRLNQHLYNSFTRKQQSNSTYTISPDFSLTIKYNDQLLL